MIKVPGTDAGVRAFEEFTALGVNVNVTLLFAVDATARSRRPTSAGSRAA